MTKNKSIITISSYFIIYLLGSLVVIYLLTAIVAKANNIEYSALLEAVSNLNRGNSYYNLAVFVNALGNMILYLIMFIALIAINYKTLIEEFKKIKGNYLSFFIIAICGFVLLYGLTYIINYIYDLYNIGESTNQNTIESYILNGNGLITFMAVVLFAPIVEELVYRYAVFDIAKNRVIAYISSIILFALPHMLSTNTDILNWFLLLIPYLISGAILALIYDQSKNIYASYLAHLLNNLLAFILIMVL